MEKISFKKIYCKLSNITKATCTLKAEGVGYEEMAFIQGRAAQVVKIIGNEVTLQVFSGTEGLSTDSEVIFTGESPGMAIGDHLEGRFFSPFGKPIDGYPIMEGTIRNNIEVGMLVRIVLKKDQRNGNLTEGVVDKILTKSPKHSHGIKVRLEDGQVGRVKEIVEDE